MLDKPLFALSSSHEAQIHPHRLLNSHVADMHDKRIWQIRRPILPCGKRQPCVLRIDRPQANAERRGVMFPTRPSLPKQGAPGTLTLSLACVADPKQLNHGVGKGKTAIRCALSEVPIWRSLMQPDLTRFSSSGPAGAGKTEQLSYLEPQ